MNVKYYLITVITDYLTIIIMIQRIEINLILPIYFDKEFL